MRVGHNPAKDIVIHSHHYHRIIVPVYVPALNGYYKDAYAITKMCIDSLHNTRHSKSYLTVVNNGSCKEISHYLQECFENGIIDQLIHQRENIGKIDAVIPIARTCDEPLITISDGDVLFKPNWMQAVEDVYNSFPEAGMVSPVPHGTTYSYHTGCTIFDAALQGILKFQSQCNPEDMLLFAKSIDKENTMYKKAIRLKYQLTVTRDEVSAVVGCGHFVSTLRKEVFKKAPESLSKLAYASTADHDYIDIPVGKTGFWRLATIGNYAYHMGNTLEAWMPKHVTASFHSQPALSKVTAPIPVRVPPVIKKLIVERFLLSSKIRPLFFKYLGLKEGLNEY